MPHALQKATEIARALAIEPSLVLLDEPASGLTFEEKVRLSGLISQVVKEKGITIILIEHDMKIAMTISQWIIVLDYGKKIFEGSPTEVQRNEVVIAAYLGEEGK